MDKWAGDGKTLMDLLARTAGDGGDADLVGKTLDFLEMNKLERFYAHTIERLAARVPDGEASGHERSGRQVDATIRVGRHESR